MNENLKFGFGRVLKVLINSGLVGKILHLSDLYKSVARSST